MGSVLSGLGWPGMSMRCNWKARINSENSMSENELGYTHTVSPGYRMDGRHWCEPRWIVSEATRRIHVVEFYCSAF